MNKLTEDAGEVQEDIEDTDFENATLTTLGKSQENTGQTSENILFNKDLTLYAMLLAGLIVTLVILAILGLVCVQKVRDKIKAKLIAFKKKFIWNGLIRSMSISYLNLALGANQSIQGMREEPESTPFATEVSAYAIMTFLVLYFLICTCYLACNRDNLDNADVKAKVQNIYAGVQVRRSRWTILYYPLFIARRLLFVMVPLMVLGYTAQQIQILILADMFYVIAYCSLWPHTLLVDTVVEIVNECLQMFVYYYLLLFTDFVPDPYTRYHVYGNSFLGLIVLVMLVNIVYGVHSSIKEYRRKKYL